MDQKGNIGVVIIGSGNVAGALAHAFTGAGNPPLQIYARSRGEAADIAFRCGCQYTDKADELAEAGLYIIAVSDRSIRTLSGNLPFAKDSVVAHTAGSVGLDVFPPTVKNGAVFYPLQTISKGRDIDFTDVPILIEGTNSQSLASVRKAAEIISGNVHEVDSARRAVVHVGAVFVSNFTNYMYTVGEMLLKEAGEDFSLLKPLIMETARKAVEADSPRDVQTGPAIRNDFQTKSLHCELLEQKPDLRNIYINLSNNIWETSKKI